MKFIVLNEWVRAEGGVTATLTSIPAASVKRVKAADQYALTPAQKACVQSVVSVKGEGLVYVRESVTEVTDLLNAK